MPVINFSYSDLCALMGKEIPKQVLRDSLPMLGSDLQSAEDSSDEMSFEFFPDRPDLYSVEGIARALKAFLGIEPGLRSYAVSESGIDLFADPSVEDVRPFIWSSIVEGNDMNDALIRSMMDLQESLHGSLGRNRRKVAIGIHDLSKVKPPFHYKAVLPDELSFVPLQGSRKMTPAEILKEHEKGKAYAFVLEGKKRYPIIVDSVGEVLSFPPVINGIATAVTENTRDILVDCTGTDINAVKSAVNILTTALAERGGKIKTVKLHQGGKTHVAPDLSPLKVAVDTAYVNQWIGTSLDPHAMAGCLRRMGLGADVAASGLTALVPAYRADIMHAVDIAEDVATGYGFERFGGSLPAHATFGTELPANAFANTVKPILTGLGYFEVVTLSLSNPRDQYHAMGLPEDASAIRVRNPVSENHTLVRTSVLPSLMTVLKKNKHRELPQKLFEVGDVVVASKNRKMLAGVAIHPKASFTEGKSLAQSVMSALGLKPEMLPDDTPTFLPGRSAKIVSGGRTVGLFGEVSPATIEAFGLGNPIVAFEFDLDALRDLCSHPRSGDRAPCSPKQ